MVPIIQKVLSKTIFNNKKIINFLFPNGNISSS